MKSTAAERSPTDEQLDHVEVSPGHPLHDGLVDLIDLGSALIVDADRDGRIQGGERKGAIAQGPEWKNEEDS